MNAQTKTENCRRAFTLIELSAVIAILAILAAVVVPAVGSLKSGANETKCVSNLRQLGVAFAAYSAENNLKIPPYSANEGSGHTTLVELLRPYTGGGEERTQIKIWECPLQAIKGAGDGKLTYGYSGNPFLLVNQRDAAHGGSGDVDSLVSRASVPRHSELLLLIDAGQRTPSGWATSILNNTKNKTGISADSDKPWVGKPFTEPDEDLTSGARYRHDGKANILFLDGHVSPVRKGDVLEKNVFTNY